MKLFVCCYLPVFSRFSPSLNVNLFVCCLGIVVPSADAQVGDKKPKRPVYDNRKKKKFQKQTSTEGREHILSENHTYTMD